MLNQQYKEFVRIKSALLVYLIVCGGIAFLGIAGVLASPHHGIEIQSGRQITIPLMLLLLIAAIPSGIFATVLGAGLSSENAHTLPWSWTKPVSRSTYALGMFIVDLGAIVIAYVMTLVVLELLPLAVFGLAGYITLGPSDFGALLRGLVFPIAVYCVLQAYTASLKRNAGLVLGLSWPLGSIMAGFKEVPLPHPFSDVVAALNLVNPWAYASLHFASGDFSPPSPNLVQTMTSHGIALAMLAVLGVIVAIYQWNRLEA